jgi:hypothetical protein
MKTPTLAEIRDEVLMLGIRAEQLRYAEGFGSTADLMERLALDLGRHYEGILDEIRILGRIK